VTEAETPPPHTHIPTHPHLNPMCILLFIILYLRHPKCLFCSCTFSLLCITKTSLSPKVFKVIIQYFTAYVHTPYSYESEQVADRRQETRVTS
jgi:hypothetical protein